jgi:hypothetical protein
MSDDLRAILHAAAQVLAPLFPYGSAPIHHRLYPGLVLLASGLDEGSGGVGEHAALLFEPVTPEHFFLWTTEFFGAGHPFSVTVEGALQRQGWQLVEEEPALVLARIPPPSRSLPRSSRSSACRMSRRLPPFGLSRAWHLPPSPRSSLRRTQQSPCWLASLTGNPSPRGASAAWGPSPRSIASRRSPAMSAGVWNSHDVGCARRGGTTGPCQRHLDGDHDGLSRLCADGVCTSSRLSDVSARHPILWVGPQ